MEDDRKEGRKGLEDGDAEPSGRFRRRSADEIVGVHRKAGRTAEAARLSRIIVRRTRRMTRDEFN